MTIRRRPIPRLHHFPASSLRYELILNGAVRRYPDGREVCTETSAGYREYQRRLEKMLARQNHKCCLCGKRLSRHDATFEHQRRRGIGGGFRDDRIEKDGLSWNGAAHWICNRERG